MKTKALLSRYPRKISLLKDLQRRYPRQMVLPKSMKTGIELEIPSKISVLKDLTGAFRSRRACLTARELAGNLELSKNCWANAVIKQLTVMSSC
jgi:hypothetical protein